MITNLFVVNFRNIYGGYLCFVGELSVEETRSGWFGGDKEKRCIQGSV
jgi:hypothetical protein